MLPERADRKTSRQAKQVKGPGVDGAIERTSYDRQLLNELDLRLSSKIVGRAGRSDRVWKAHGFFFTLARSP